jgi:hypothetical protein
VLDDRAVVEALLQAGWTPPGLLHHPHTDDETTSER